MGGRRIEDNASEGDSTCCRAVIAELLANPQTHLCEHKGKKKCISTTNSLNLDANPLSLQALVYSSCSSSTKSIQEPGGDGHRDVGGAGNPPWAKQPHYLCVGVTWARCCVAEVACQALESLPK